MNKNELLGCEKHAKDCGVTLTDTGLGEFNCTCNYGVANGLAILIEMRSEQKCYFRESRIELASLDIKRELDTRTAPKSTEAERDKERLDWCESHLVSNSSRYSFYLARRFTPETTFRQAIDAAIENEKGN